MVKFGNLEITEIKQTSTSNGKGLIFHFVITTTQVTAPESVQIFCGWKYATGNGAINYTHLYYNFPFDSADVAEHGQAVTSWAYNGDNVRFDLDHLFCGATYSFYLKIVSKDDEWVSDPQGFFCASSFTLPTNNYMIPERPTQQTQAVYYDGRYQGESPCCVSCALTAAKEAQELRCGKGVVQNSVGWFYGATANQDGNTTYETALNFLRDNGAMPYRLVDTPPHIAGFPDIYFRDDRPGYIGAKSLYQGNIDLTKSRPQKIRAWKRLTGDDLFHWADIFSAIQRTAGNSSSVVVMTVGTNQAMYDTSTDGVMPFSYGNYVDGHMMLVLGWKSINGRLHFVCQNSWGADRGDDGVFYIPFVNVRTGNGDKGEYWTGINDFFELVDDPNAPDIPEPSVEPWSWMASNGSASASQTQLAHTAVTSHGATADFSYLVWNDLVDKVNEAAGGSWNTLYATLAQTKMTASDKVLTAKRFNALRQNIGSHVSTGIAEAAKGDAVKGSWFVTLADKLNQWINSL